MNESNDEQELNYSPFKRLEGNDDDEVLKINKMFYVVSFVTLKLLAIP